MSIIKAPNHQYAIHVQENVTTEGQKLVGHLALHHAPIHLVFDPLPALKRYDTFFLSLMSQTDGAKVELTHVKRIEAQHSQLILLVFHH